MIVLSYQKIFKIFQKDWVKHYLTTVLQRFSDNSFKGVYRYGRLESRH